MKKLVISLFVFLSLLGVSTGYCGDQYVDKVQVKLTENIATLAGDVVEFDSKNIATVICPFKRDIVTDEELLTINCPTKQASPLSYNHGTGEANAITYYADLTANVDMDNNTTVTRTVYAKNGYGVITVAPQRRKFFVQTGRFVIHPSENR